MWDHYPPSTLIDPKSYTRPSDRTPTGGFVIAACKNVIGSNVVVAEPVANRCNPNPKDYTCRPAGFEPSSIRLLAMVNDFIENNNYSYDPTIHCNSEEGAESVDSLECDGNYSMTSSKDVIKVN